MPLNAQPLWDWIAERHRIFLKRAAGAAAPWSDDPIMQEYRFCNVFRELDKVTAWLRENWREPYADSPHLWIAMCLARQVNWPATLAEVGFPVDGYDAKLVRQRLEARKARGEKVYTGAYMISAPTGRYDDMAKPQYTAEVVVGALWQAQDEFHAFFKNGRQPTLEEVHAWLRRFRGWGDFMAYEVVTDLRHTRYLNKAADINTWAVAGPGAIRGLNRLHGRPYKKSMTQMQAGDEMRELLALSKGNLPDFVPQLELRDIEHSLCETDKWLRIHLGEGKMRAKYKAA
ncbi:MAG: nucleotide kinase domain-containing protein [Bdellovibrionales bacterium]